MEYSELAIECCLMIRQVFRLPLRQTEGLLTSLVRLMDLDIAVPDYSCLSKRSIDLRLERLASTVTAGSHILVDSTGLKVYGKDEWNQEKYGIKPQRSWQKLHLAIDEKHQIIASDLTEKSVGDTSALGVLLDQVDAFDTFMADGAYDGDPVYAQILQQQPSANIIIPPEAAVSVRVINRMTGLGMPVSVKVV